MTQRRTEPEPTPDRVSARDVDALLELYAARVEASPHNLLSRRGLAELRSRHLLECVAFARVLPSGPMRVLDLGSGGGLPGIVIAIVRPDLEVHLLDSTRKKAAFLAETARALRLPVRVHTGRAETLDARGEYDVVTARAVAPLERLIGWAVPLLAPGGMLYAIKGAQWVSELEAAADIIARTGVQVLSTPADQEPRDATTPGVIVIRRA
jgi:16S rRNA (guanine527-N7)-methyltransferase